MKQFSIVEQDAMFRDLAKCLGYCIAESPLDERQAKGEKAYWGVWIKGTSETFQGMYFNPLTNTDLAMDLLLFFSMSLNSNHSVRLDPESTPVTTLGIVRDGRLICGSTFTVNHKSELKQNMRHLIVEAAYKVLNNEVS